MARLLPGGYGLWLPVDDSLISGPVGRLHDMGDLLRTVAPRVDALLAFQGTLMRHAEQLHGTATIENLTASTVGAWHTEKVQVAKVADAVRRGADAVAVHLNFTDKSQREMLRVIGAVRHECDYLGIPLVAIVYPRSTQVPGVDENYDGLRRTDPGEYGRLVGHAVRLAVELGADIVKTQFVPGDGLMRHVVEGSLGRPVVVAGGPLGGLDFIELATEALKAGAHGLAFGRRIFQADDMIAGLENLRKCLATARLPALADSALKPSLADGTEE
jgi:DhnA family fructose-bisphosphate aldolase class Ia